LLALVDEVRRLRGIVLEGDPGKPPEGYEPQALAQLADAQHPQPAPYTD